MAYQEGQFLNLQMAFATLILDLSSSTLDCLTSTAPSVQWHPPSPAVRLPSSAFVFRHIEKLWVLNARTSQGTATVVTRSCGGIRPAM